MPKIKHHVWIPSGMSSEKKSKLSKELYAVVAKHTGPKDTGYKKKVYKKKTFYKKK